MFYCCFAENLRLISCVAFDDSLTIANGTLSSPRADYNATHGFGTSYIPIAQSREPCNAVSLYPKPSISGPSSFIYTDHCRTAVIHAGEPSSTMDRNNL